MMFGERFYHWNLKYDALPPEWRFQFVLWPLIALGAINIQLTLSTRFPFGLLLLLGILLITAARVPYVLARDMPAEALASGAGHPGLQISAPDWLIDLNRRYDAMPEPRRFWVIPVVLVVAGAINMMLTIGRGFPFGLLFLLALLALIVMRAPYASGWFKVTQPEAPDMPYNPEIDHAPTQASLEEPAPGTSATIAAAQTADDHHGPATQSSSGSEPS
jgi:hypothetical protein